MAKFIGEENEGRITEIMHRLFGDTEADRFLWNEIKRYVPELSKADEEEIRAFVKTQRDFYLEGVLPEFGIPLAFLNPTFIDDVNAVRMQETGLEVYTRGAVKENGYRMQLRINPDGRVSANTRQFTPFDLRMFPELADTIEQLPVMIGDAELISRWYKHHDGFGRVQERIPNQKYWPSRKTGRVEDEFLAAYLADQTLFREGAVKKDLELTLAFHGMLAIADPTTWDVPRERQIAEPLCQLPVDYRRIDEILDRLGEYMERRNLNARVVERKVLTKKEQLRAYVEEQRRQELEGAVVVRTAWNPEGRRSFHFAKTIKIKNYETVDCIVLGLYTEGWDKETPLREQAVTGALLGLYDERSEQYVPAFKVNLDPEGPQIKTAGQKERLVALRQNLVELAKERQGTEDVVTVVDIYRVQGRILINRVLKGKNLETEVEQLLENMPVGKDVIGLFDLYKADQDTYEQHKKGTKKADTKTDKCIQQYKGVFAALKELEEQDKKGYKEFAQYFSKAKEVKATSQKLKRPQVLFDTNQPVIVEANVFQVRYGEVPYAAGFHSWFCNSFYVNNAFADHIRFDKSTTTDYGTIIEIARKHTGKKKRILRKD
ncbi:hypothetical protein HZC31_07825 [Candidatus Woesearchaeota archaeon]|nr:hypothetical protein [Candidatus Woesearchaeota archaeon]